MASHQKVSIETPSISSRQRFKDAALRVMAAQRIYRNSFNVPDPHPGSAPGIDPRSPQPIYEGLQRSCAIQCYDYNATNLTYRNDLNNANLTRFLNTSRPDWSKIRWINVDGLSWDILKTLAIHYDLHPLALEDALHIPKRSKADFYENQIFLSLLCLSTESPDSTHNKGDQHDIEETAKIEDDPIFLNRVFGGTVKGIWSALSSRSSSFASHRDTNSRSPSSASQHTPRSSTRSSKQPWPIFSNTKDAHPRTFRSQNTTEPESSQAPFSTSPSQSPPARMRSPSFGKILDNFRDPEGAAVRRRATTLRRSSLTNGRQSTFTHSDRDPKATIDQSEYRLFKTSIFSQGGEYMYAMVRNYRDWIVMMEPCSIFFLENGTIITMFPDNGERITAPIQRRLVRTKTLLRMSEDPSFLVNTIIDTIVDHGLPIMEKYRHYIGELEEEVMMKPKYSFTRVLHLVQSELQLFRRAFAPIHSVISTLRFKEHDQSNMISKLTRTYLADVLDNATTVMDSLDADFQWSKDLIELIFNSMSYQSNESMKTLAIMSAYFMPWTFIAGIYGMNFAGTAIPELSWTWGYIWFWGLVVACGGMVWIFLHQKMLH